MKKVLIVFLVLIFLTGCYSEPANDSAQGEVDTEDLQEFTLEEIEQYNGQDGNKAYVVIDNIVYDLTAVEAWEGGTHNGHMAGNELSDEILEAPHEKSVLTDLPKVGIIKE